jgi:hypothetical protein
MPQDAHTMRGPNHGIGASSPSSSSSAMTSPPYRWSNLAEFAFVIHRSLNHLQRAVHNQCHLDLCRQHFKVATLGCLPSTALPHVANTRPQRLGVLASVEFSPEL